MNSGNGNGFIEEVGLDCLVPKDPFYTTRAEIRARLETVQEKLNQLKIEINERNRVTNITSPGPSLT